MVFFCYFGAIHSTPLTPATHLECAADVSSMNSFKWLSLFVCIFSVALSLSLDDACNAISANIFSHAGIFSLLFAPCSRRRTISIPCVGKPCGWVFRLHRGIGVKSRRLMAAAQSIRIAGITEPVKALKRNWTGCRRSLSSDEPFHLMREYCGPFNYCWLLMSNATSLSSYFHSYTNSRRFIFVSSL